MIWTEIRLFLRFPSNPPDLHSCKVDRYRKECAPKECCAFMMERLSVHQSNNHNYEHIKKLIGEAHHENPTTQSDCGSVAAQRDSHKKREIFGVVINNMVIKKQRALNIKNNPDRWVS